MEGLIEGRIVHYVDITGIHLPAMIVHVCHYPESPTDYVVCNLQVFLNNFEGHLWVSNVKFGPVGTVGCWHWIERE